MLQDISRIMNRINQIKKRFGMLAVNTQRKTGGSNKKGLSTFDKIRDEVLKGQGVLKSGKTLSSGITGKSVTDINKIADFYAGKFKLPPALLKSIIQVDSSYNPKALSSRGARGLMQLMPSALKRYGVSNPFSPDENIKAGSQMLKGLLEENKYDYRRALAAYNSARGLKGGAADFRGSRQYINKVLEQYMKNK